VRVSSDIRIIVHRTADSVLLCYLDHHDSAYRWAGRGKRETHLTTGAALLVETRERMQDVTSPRYAEVDRHVPGIAKPPNCSQESPSKCC
jgi:hypothetical protein